MPQSLQIRDIPDALADRLSRRAKAHGRSSQAELLAILEETLMPKTISALEALRRAREMGLSTADEAAAMVREDRDAR